MQRKRGREVILGVTASIAIYKACEIVRRLRKEDFRVNVVMTREAEELIKPVVFQSLSGNKVFRGLFSEPEAWEIEHVALAEKAGKVKALEIDEKFESILKENLNSYDNVEKVVAASEGILKSEGYEDKLGVYGDTSKFDKSGKLLLLLFLTPKLGVLISDNPEI